MSTPMIFGVYGTSGTGKTTLITRLVTQLTNEGYKVATIKRTNKETSMDTVNKDTWRHHEAGARLVVFSSLCETDFLLNEALSASEIIRRISLFGRYDLILMEGADDPHIPKIQLGTGEQRSNTIASYRGNVKEILTLIKQKLDKKPTTQHLVVTVNGKNIPLTEFPEQIITHTILGLLGSLKGVKDIRDVTIELLQEKK
jgi:molybdopterin-guanine dinucleotide biosynthesis protein B